MALNEKFASYSTRIAFNLNITRTQIQYLEILYLSLKNPDKCKFEIEQSIRGEHGIHNPHIWVPAMRKLIDMGLVEHNHLHKTENSNKKGDRSWYYRFTEAGEHVVSLLQIAGLISKIKESKKAA